MVEQDKNKLLPLFDRSIGKFILTLLTTVFGFAFTIMYSYLGTLTLFIVGIVYPSLLIIAFMLYERQKMKTENISNESKDTKIKLIESQKRENMSRYNLMNNALDNLSETLRSNLIRTINIDYELDKLLENNKKIKKEDILKFIEENDNKTPPTKETLRGLCEVFNRDIYGLDKTKFFKTLVKATFVEPGKDSKGQDILERTNSWYPPGEEPNVISKILYIHKEPGSKSTAVKSYLAEETIMISSIPDELKKPIEKRRWVPLYEGQAERYKSMVSFISSIGEKGTSNRKVIGVTTIDTNREYYFNEDDLEFKALFATIALPFRTLISYYEERERLQKRYCKLLTKLT